MAHHAAYTNTTLGKSLLDSLDELIQRDQISPQLAQRVLTQLDKTVDAALAEWLHNQGPSEDLQGLDKAWTDRLTFFLKNAEFREAADQVLVNKVKIVASKGTEASGDVVGVPVCGRPPAGAGAHL